MNNESSFVFEKAFSRAALPDGDGQEVGGHVRHQDLLHVAQRRPPCHLIQAVIEPRRGRPVQEVGLFHLWKISGMIWTLTRFGLVFEVCGC